MNTKTRKFLNAFLVTLLALVLLAIFLSPFMFMVFTSLKTGVQISVIGSPLWPAAVATYEYEGEELEVFTVPMPDGSEQNLAMLKPGRKESIFLDPSNPGVGEIIWEGSWRALDRPWQLSPAWGNYVEVWETIEFPLDETSITFLIKNFVLPCDGKRK